jgi:hypothetical protein
VDISLLALWFVCSLGATVFAAAGVRSRAGSMAGLVAFAFGAWLVRQPFAPVTSAVALGATLVAAVELVKSPRVPYAPSAAGVLAGVWTGVLQNQGLPLGVAALVAGALPIVSATLRIRRPGFAPAALRDEALLFMVILGVVAASAPGITEGWRAATNLNAQGGDTAAEIAIPMWTLGIASAALVSGGLFSMWSRR